MKELIQALRGLKDAIIELKKGCYLKERRFHQALRKFDEAVEALENKLKRER